MTRFTMQANEATNSSAVKRDTEMVKQENVNKFRRVSRQDDEHTRYLWKIAREIQSRQKYLDSIE
jgi:hypothetical protein